MLHHLFIDQADLLLVKNKTYGLYIKAFQAYKQLHTHLEDFYNNLEGEGLDVDLDLDNKNLQEDKESPLIVTILKTTQVTCLSRVQVSPDVYYYIYSQDSFSVFFSSSFFLLQLSILVILTSQLENTGIKPLTLVSIVTGA